MKFPSRIPKLIFCLVSVRRWGAILGIVCTALSAGGQTAILNLRNGDRISGVLLAEEPGQITLSNAVIGRVVVSIGQIEKWEKKPVEPVTLARPTMAISGAQLERLRELSGLYDSNRIAAAEFHRQRGEILAEIATNAPGTNLVTLKPLEPAKPLPPPASPVLAKPPARWSGDAQAGIDLAFSTKDRQLFNARLRLIYAHLRLRNTLDYVFTYGRAEGELSAHLMTLSDKTDFDISKRTYLYNLVGLGYDKIRKLDAHFEEGPGAGYRLFTRPHLAVRCEYGLNYQLDNYTGNIKRDSGFHRLAQDFTWKISSRLSFDEKFEFFPKLAEWDVYRLRLEANLRYALSARIYLNATALNLYNTHPNVRGVDRNDLQLRSSIGMRF